MQKFMLLILNFVKLKITKICVGQLKVFLQKGNMNLLCMADNKCSV